jgi:hypothetical protein
LAKADCKPKARKEQGVHKNQALNNKKEDTILQPTHSWTIKFLACIVAMLAWGPESARAVTIPGSLPPPMGFFDANGYCESAIVADVRCPGGAIRGLPLTYPSSNATVFMDFLSDTGLIDPAIRITNSLDSGGPLQSFVSADLTYSFRVDSTSPLQSPFIPVPVDVMGNLFSMQPPGLPYPVAEASILISLNGEEVFSQTAEGTQGTQSIDLGALPFSVLPDTLYTVTLFAGSDLDVGVPNCCLSYPTKVSAQVDPVIAIDPGFANASLYTIEFSTDSTVPEPATFVTMISAICALLAAARLRRRA